MKFNFFKNRQEKSRKEKAIKQKNVLNKEINKMLTKKCWDNLDNLQKQKEI